MTMRCEVAVVGGGPVGLLLGCRLAQLGIPFVILEKERELSAGSRAIGIHAPSLECLDTLGLLPRFLDEGVRIQRAQARSSRALLGTVDLRQRPGRFGFALSLPQPISERILDDALAQRAPGAVLRGREVVTVMPSDVDVALGVRDPDGGVRKLSCRWLVACDGHKSLVRRAVGIRMTRSTRPESFLMGDFADDTPYGADAVIFLADEGLVECFPLPRGRRRWVVEAPTEQHHASGDAIAALVNERTGVWLRSDTVSMTSAFRVEQRLAARFHRDRVILAGDAAHVVSPFGAQGMNLGWQGAWRVASALEGIVSGDDPELQLARYQRLQRAAARRAMRRAALNGFIGRRHVPVRLRNGLVKGLLQALPDTFLASLFTMAPLTAASLSAPAHRDAPRP